METESLQEVLDQFQCRLSPVDLSESLYAYWRKPKAFPETAAFLRSLRVPACVVSNIDEDDLKAAIAHNGWEFPHVVTSEGCRSYKPRPEMFEAALCLLGLAPEQVLHVGDSLSGDVRGAIEMGIPVAWINRRNRERPEWASSLAGEFGDLDELRRFIEQEQ